MAHYIHPPLWELDGEVTGRSETPVGVSDCWLGEPLPLVLMSLLLLPRSSSPFSGSTSGLHPPLTRRSSSLKGSQLNRRNSSSSRQPTALPLPTVRNKAHSSSRDVNDRTSITSRSIPRQDVLLVVRFCQIFTLPEFLRPTKSQSHQQKPPLPPAITGGPLAIGLQVEMATGVALQSDDIDDGDGSPPSLLPPPSTSTGFKGRSSFKGRSGTTSTEFRLCSGCTARYTVMRTSKRMASHSSEIDGFPWAAYHHGGDQWNPAAPEQQMAEVQKVVENAFNRWPSSVRWGRSRTNKKGGSTSTPSSTLSRRSSSTTALAKGGGSTVCSLPPTLLESTKAACSSFWLQERCSENLAADAALSISLRNKIIPKLEVTPYVELVLTCAIFGIVPPPDVLVEMVKMTQVDQATGRRSGGGSTSSSPHHEYGNPLAPILCGLAFGPDGWKDAFHLVLTFCHEIVIRSNTSRSQPASAAQMMLPAPVLHISTSPAHLRGGAPLAPYGQPDEQSGFWDLLPLVLLSGGGNEAQKGSKPDTSGSSLFYVKLLCENFPSLFTEDSWIVAKRTPFHYCWANLPLIRWLMDDCGIRFSTVEPLGSTSSLLPMVESGRLDILHYIHQNHPEDCNFMPWLLGESPLSFAARLDQVDVLRFYIEEVGVVNSDSGRRKNPLPPPRAILIPSSSSSALGEDVTTPTAGVKKKKILWCDLSDIQWSCPDASKSLVYLEEVCGYSVRDSN